MDKILDSVISKVYKHLEKNGLDPDIVLVENDELNDVQTLVVQIAWGDWKHEHIKCDLLMKELGYICIDVIIDEEDGSYTYSAYHVYEKVNMSLKCLFVED